MRIKKPLFRRRLFISDEWYVLPRTQKQGEMDLKRLAEKARREESFAYFPEGKLWLMNTIEHTETEEQLSVEFMPIDKFRGYKEKIYYHIHPDCYKINYKFNLNDKIKSNKKLEDTFLRYLTALPSPGDVNTAIKLEEEMRIVSADGVFSLQGNGLNQEIEPEDYLELLSELSISEKLKNDNSIASLYRLSEVINVELEGLIWTKFRDHNK